MGTRTHLAAGPWRAAVGRAALALVALAAMLLAGPGRAVAQDAPPAPPAPKTSPWTDPAV
ncbi:MAG: hypothetical protein JNM10_05580, partial [Planctomycetia bacterium]|nr:hypothetical protein [Planctomycetia bacterium]